jgi:hypothetical protein
LQHFQSLQSQQVGKTSSTHFAKPKLQKHDSLHAKNSKVPKYITVESKTKIRQKDPLSFTQRRLQVCKKMVGIFKKMKIPRNSHNLQVIQPYPTSRT